GPDFLRPGQGHRLAAATPHLAQSTVLALLARRQPRHYRGDGPRAAVVIIAWRHTVPIEFVSGDLFANAHGVEAFAHGCNCQGSMGAGIAKGFRERYPEMYEQYRGRCKAEPRQFNLGDCWLWKQKGNPSVFNLGTQERFWHARASYEAIEQ